MGPRDLFSSPAFRECECCQAVTISELRYRRCRSVTVHVRQGKYMTGRSEKSAMPGTSVVEQNSSLEAHSRSDDYDPKYITDLESRS